MSLEDSLRYARELKAEGLIPFLQNPAPIAASEFASRSEFLGISARALRLRDKVAGFANATARFFGAKKDAFSRDELSREEFKMFGGEDANMKYFEGVTPADIEAFKQRQYLDYMTRLALDRGDSMASVVFAQMAQNILFDPISWSALLTGGVVSVGALRFVTAANRALPILGSGETLLSRMTIAAVSEGIANVPYDIAFSAQMLEDPNTGFTLSDAAVQVGVGTLLAGALGAGIVAGVEAFKVAGATIQMTAEMRKAVDEVVEQAGEEAIDNINNFMAKVREANADLIDDLGVSPETAELFAKVSAADGFEVAPDELIKIADEIERIESSGSIEEILRKAAAREDVGSVGDASTANVDSRVEAEATLGGEHDALSMLDEFVLNDLDRLKKSISIDGGPADLARSSSDEIVAIIGAVTGKDLSALSREQREILSEVVLSRMSVSADGAASGMSADQISELMLDAIDGVVSDLEFRSLTDALSGRPAENITLDIETEKAVADAAALDGEARAARADELDGVVEGDLGGEFRDWFESQKAEDAGILEYSWAEFDTSKELGAKLLRAFGIGDVGEDLAASVGARVAMTLRSLVRDANASVDDVIKAAAENSDTLLRAVDAVLSDPATGDKAISEAFRTRLSQASSVEVDPSMHTPEIRDRVATEKSSPVSDDLRTEAVEYAKLNDISESVIKRIDEEIKLRDDFLDALRKCNIDG